MSMRLLTCYRNTPYINVKTWAAVSSNCVCIHVGDLQLFPLNSVGGHARIDALAYRCVNKLWRWDDYGENFQVWSCKLFVRFELENPQDDGDLLCSLRPSVRLDFCNISFVGNRWAASWISFGCLSRWSLGNEIKETNALNSRHTSFWKERTDILSKTANNAVEEYLPGFDATVIISDTAKKWKNDFLSASIRRGWEIWLTFEDVIKGNDDQVNLHCENFLLSLMRRIPPSM